MESRHCRALRERGGWGGGGAALSYPQRKFGRPAKSVAGVIARRRPQHGAASSARGGAAPGPWARPERSDGAEGCRGGDRRPGGPGGRVLAAAGAIARAQPGRQNAARSEGQRGRREQMQCAPGAHFRQEETVPRARTIAAV